LSDSHGIDIEKEGIVGLIRVVGAYRRMIGALVIVGSLATFGVCQLIPKSWQARATIVPSSLLTGKNQEMGLSSLASQFSGVGMLLSGGQETSSSLYPWILSSREVGEKALQTRFSGVDGETQPLKIGRAHV